MRKCRHILKKTKIRSNNRRRVMKKSTSATITARHNTYRLRLQEEHPEQQV